jgi:hypothetical protein
MGGFALNVLEECTASKMFLDSKNFHWICDVMKMEGKFWELLFALIQNDVLLVSPLVASL